MMKKGFKGEYETRQGDRVGPAETIEAFKV
jgi:hypothetical protein